MNPQAKPPRFGKEWAKATGDLNRLPETFSIDEAVDALGYTRIYIQKVILKRMRELGLIERIEGTNRYRRSE